jgi:cytochrome c-type biogenesis protein CcmH/NrfG
MLLAATPAKSAKKKVIVLDAIDVCMGWHLQTPVLVVVGEAPPVEGLDHPEDDVLYRQALALERQGKPDEARKLWENLTTGHPNSPRATEAWFRLGELLAASTRTDDLKLATSALEKAADGPDARFHEAALFRLARTQARLDQDEQAHETLRQVLSQPSGELRPEALRDLAISLGDTCTHGSLDQAKAFMDKVGAVAWQLDFWRALAVIYEEENDLESAVTSWKKVLQLAPLDPRAPLAQQSICDDTLYLRQPERLKAERASLANNYKPGAAWFEANKSNPAALESAKRALEDRPSGRVPDPPCDENPLVRVIATKRPTFAACLESARKHKDGLKGRMTFTFDIGNDSTIRTRSGEDKPAEPSLSQCVGDTLRGLKAPPQPDACTMPITLLFE